MVMRDNAHILTINAGSSSVKCSVFRVADMSEVMRTSVENIGQPTSRITINEATRAIVVPTHAVAAELLIKAITKEIALDAIQAVGHRVVHGGPDYYKPQRVTPRVMSNLKALIPFDPEHLPAQLMLIKELSGQLPRVLQVACFDTGFHHDLPVLAKTLPIPRRLAAEGVRRYGFHGLSYEFILTELRRVEGDTAANGRVVIAHLGSGVSLASLKGGKPVDTTMGMTPASGVPMSTRSGDLDPGLVLYLQKMQGYNIDTFNRMVNFESGLLGISETTADMEKLLEIESHDQRAKEAVDIFCYQVKKSIAALAATIGGLDTLVFTGGMGENAPKIRERICEGLEFLGIEIDHTQNGQSARLISSSASRAGVHVIHTNEAQTIARQTSEIISSKQGEDR